MSDHLASPWSAAQHGLDAWVALSVAAAETRRVRLGPLVSPVTFRAPALVARMAEGLRDLSDGRFVLGLGLGWNTAEHHHFGIPFPAAAERARLLAEAVAHIRTLVGDTAPRLAPNAPSGQAVPRPRVPILLGGSGTRSTLPLVARYADEWNVTTASPTAYAAHLANLTAACEAVGRDPATLRRSIACGVLVGRDDADLVDRAWRVASRVPPLAEALAAPRRPTDVHDAMATVRQAAASLGWLAGVAADVRGQLALFGAVGVEEVMLGLYDFDDMAAVDLIASELLPAAR